MQFARKHFSRGQPIAYGAALGLGLLAPGSRPRRTPESNARQQRACPFGLSSGCREPPVGRPPEHATDRLAADDDRAPAGIACQSRPNARRSRTTASARPESGLRFAARADNPGPSLLKDVDGRGTRQGPREGPPQLGERRAQHPAPGHGIDAEPSPAIRLPLSPGRPLGRTPGAPGVIEEFADRYDPQKIRLLTAQVGPAQLNRLNAPGVRVDRSADLMGPRLIKGQLGLQKSDFVLLNGAAVSPKLPALRRPLTDAGHLDRATWLIHEDVEQLQLSPRICATRSTSPCCATWSRPTGSNPRPVAEVENGLRPVSRHREGEALRLRVDLDDVTKGTRGRLLTTAGSIS